MYVSFKIKLQGVMEANQEKISSNEPVPSMYNCDINRAVPIKPPFKIKSTKKLRLFLEKLSTDLSLSCTLFSKATTSFFF
mmetsp:Transcript_22517/g.51556  ORF Transcript_22517/g.51556 Transcript_22517/m.51556 type:complete len:80 (+) Transcript_22517:401-640(+)